jgi:hypothetical protein
VAEGIEPRSLRGGERRRFQRIFDRRHDKPGEVFGAIVGLIAFFVSMGWSSPFLACSTATSVAEADLC